MDLTQTGLFALAERRLAWLDKRQEVLAQNIANSDTPGFQARDLAPFGAALARANVAPLVQTQPNHLPGTQGGVLRQSVAERPKERAPDGNAVSVEDELMKVADTETSQELVTNLYTKYLGLFRVALGRSQ
ncbi:MAG: flagellar basal body rod protein FlgB [Acetobacteraceae bacterium]|nr:flagellar basal body rod protein FlgB [Acetobacteraceae bacterium]MBV8575636.1 flagellar basal body rod protein FlgB [Acetobacteraceae bacterium]